MYSFDRFEFGQYESLLLSEVFFGKEEIDFELIKFILNSRSNSILHANPKLSQYIGIEISDTLIKITPKLEIEAVALKRLSEEVVNKLFEINDYDLHKYNLYYFNSGELERKIISGNKNYLHYCYKKDWETTNPFCLSPLVISGHPKYVEWLIVNVDTFYLNLDEIEDLYSKEDVVLFDKFNYSFATNNIIEFKPVFSKKIWNFPDQIMEINNNKFFKNAHKEEIYSLRGYENVEAEIEDAKNQRRQLERDNFNSLTDGQFGDFDGYPGRIDDLGDLLGL